MRLGTGTPDHMSSQAPVHKKQVQQRLLPHHQLCRSATVS